MNPISRKNKLKNKFIGLKGLSEDLRYYGEKVKLSAYEDLKNIYPLSTESNKVIAWLFSIPRPFLICISRCS